MQGRKICVFQWFIAAAGLVLLSYACWVSNTVLIGFGRELILLLVFFVLLEWMSIPLHQGGHISLSFALIIFSINYNGLYATLSVFYLGTIISQTLINSRINLICFLNAGLSAIVVYIADKLLYLWGYSYTGDITPITLFALMVFAVNTLIAGVYLLYICSNKNYDFRHFIKDAGIDVLTYLITVPLGLGMILLNESLGFWATLYFVCPLLLISYILRSMKTQSYLNEGLFHLHDIAFQLANSEDMNQVLDAIVFSVSRIFHTDLCWLALIDEAGGDIDVYQREGVPVGLRAVVDEKKLRETAAFFNDPFQKGIIIRPSKSTDNFETTLNGIYCSPLRIENNLQGLILIGITSRNERNYSYLLHLIPILARQAAIVLKNTSYRKALEELASTDEKTGLYNFRYFSSRLQEVFRTLSAKDNLSLLMCDLDNFKAYNDRYGHLAGDKVLRPLAEIICSSVRQSDIVARFGGDEFIVLLQGTGKSKAIEIAERIRKTVENYPFAGSKEKNGKKVTVSIGISEYPNDAVDEHDLIRKADIALYQSSKKGGRNLVSLFREQTAEK